jgi:2Fe-2S ferredoxin
MPKITFIDPSGARCEVEVKPGEDDLLAIAEEHDVRMGSACGGVCACSSCHVYVREGLASLPEMSEMEEDRLDMGFDVRPYSRLGCQCVVGKADLVVEITQESLQVWFNEHPEHRPARGG